MSPKNKNLILLGGVLLIVVIGGFLAMSFNKSSNSKKADTENVLPENENFPPIESSVKVEAVSDKLKQNITITASNLPTDVKTIDYEVTYTGKDSIQKGAIGILDIKGTTASSKVTLGTCSSGTCVYDNGGDSVKVNLKFTGSKGTRVFEKEFKI
ncbi:MAG: hypothetical protein ACMG6E_00735 [Candidatus Roizmanbacteria bacterium]